MNKKVVIIGAAASGVAAATKLVSNGFTDVTILEAENRFGGRINTIPYGSNVVDMGAQWCHGEKNNAVYEMAKDKNLLAPNIEVDRIFIRSNGESIAVDISNKLWKLAFDIYEGENYEEEKKQYKGSLGNFFAEKLRQELKTEQYKDVTAQLAHEFFALFEKFANTMDGSDTWFDSSCDPHEYEICEGDFNLNWKDKGYVTVFDLLQNKIPGSNSNQQVIDVIPLIKFNKTVSKIVYNQPDGVTKVECEDGSTFTADHLICTVSLGVLKERHWNLFEPLLPQEKIDSIDGMMIGTVDKIYLEFEKPFWNEGWPGFSCLWECEEVKQARADPVNGEWLHGIQAFFPVNPTQPNLICGWITGIEAQKMEQKSDADVKSGAEKCLRMFLKDLTIPDAKSMIRSTWKSNPHFRGSYTCYTLKAEALNASPRKLAEPIADANGKPVVQFAGEATSHDHYSCVHGAIDSGRREADRLIELYK